ncbi:MAG: STAS domain-containing protein [Bryobacteraceae bacterium]|jgi:anti-sigma B factor antagonist
MRLKAEIRDGVGVLRPQGRFVTGSDDELGSARKYLEENGINRAVIDFSAVPYIDSTGLAFVVELHKALASRGGQLFVTNVNERVREVLEMTRIDRVIAMWPDATEAEATLRAGAAC